MLLNLQCSVISYMPEKQGCVYGCSHPAISNRVINITNNNSLWNSCPLFVQYKPIEWVQWTVPFLLLLFPVCVPRRASTDPIYPTSAVNVSMFYCYSKSVLILDRGKKKKKRLVGGAGLPAASGSDVSIITITHAQQTGAHCSNLVTVNQGLSGQSGFFFKLSTYYTS